MSRENRVNPGMYTQAGRLTPDDAAREYAKQRQPLNGGLGKAHPRSRSEAWMHQAEQAREVSAPVAAANQTWGTAFVLFGAAAVCLSLYAAKRLASAAMARRHQPAPATNHTPGSTYAYGV
jgi:hypothetical protein